MLSPWLRSPIRLFKNVQTKILLFASGWVICWYCQETYICQHLLLYLIGEWIERYLLRVDDNNDFEKAADSFRIEKSNSNTSLCKILWTLNNIVQLTKSHQQANILEKIYRYRLRFTKLRPHDYHLSSHFHKYSLETIGMIRSKITSTQTTMLGPKSHPHYVSFIIVTFFTNIFFIECNKISAILS